jgi:predicted nucleic acid-binding protein
MGKILADTNVIIYLLEGDRSVATLFDNSEVYISFITELELLSSKKLSNSQSKIINQLIQKFVVFDFNNLLKELCISLRIKYSLLFQTQLLLLLANYIRSRYLLQIKSFPGSKKLMFQFIHYKTCLPFFSK